MQDSIQILDDVQFDSLIHGTKPTLILFSDGNGLRSEFAAAFKKAAETPGPVIFARIDPKQNPRAAARFDVGEKPVLVAWYCGEEIARRSRPWGADVPLAVEMLQNAAKNDLKPEEEKEPPMTEKTIVETKPVAVTDATFQKEVIESELPVVVDFWAAWCGPCRQVAPIFDKLAKEYAGKVRVAKVNVDENPGLSQTFRVMSIPTIMMIKQRTIVFNQAGALPEPVMRDLFNQLIALEVKPQQQQPAK
ncbi:MAG: thioredoxin [Anaerolineae bacterium]